MDSCPKELKPYEKAFRQKRVMRDEELWRSGIYTYSAISTALANGFSKTAKAHYMKQPLLADYEEPEQKEISEEKKIKMENLKLYMTLRISQANFEIGKALKDKDDSVS